MSSRSLKLRYRSHLAVVNNLQRLTYWMACTRPSGQSTTGHTGTGAADVGRRICISAARRRKKKAGRPRGVPIQGTKDAIPNHSQP